jgi:hypothetical protein
MVKPVPAHAKATVGKLPAIRKSGSTWSHNNQGINSRKSRIQTRSAQERTPQTSTLVRGTPSIPRSLKNVNNEVNIQDDTLGSSSPIQNFKIDSPSSTKTLDDQIKLYHHKNNHHENNATTTTTTTIPDDYV